MYRQSSFQNLFAPISTHKQQYTTVSFLCNFGRVMYDFSPCFQFNRYKMVFLYIFHLLFFDYEWPWTFPHVFVVFIFDIVSLAFVFFSTGIFISVHKCLWAHDRVEILTLYMLFMLWLAHPTGHHFWTYSWVYYIRPITCLVLWTSYVG